MKEKDLQIDRTCHVVYTKQCKRVIMDKITFHYGKEKTEEIFEKVQHQYEKYLSEYSRKDLGGSKNFHNGLGGTYDCIMIVSYYVVCKEKTSFEEIEQMTADMMGISSFKIGIINIDHSIFKRLMYMAFKNAEKKCAKWNDYVMKVDAYSKDKPLYYCFTRCPFADFVHQFGMEEIAGALCNVDYAAMEMLNTKLVRSHTCIESDHCDYTFCSCDDPYLKEHPVYVDDMGFIRNK